MLESTVCPNFDFFEGTFTVCKQHWTDRWEREGDSNKGFVSQQYGNDCSFMKLYANKIKKLKKLTVIANHLKSWILWNIWDRWSVKQFIALDERNCCYNSTSYSYRLNQFIEVFTVFTVICMQYLTLKSQAKNKLNERLISFVWQC